MYPPILRVHLKHDSRRTSNDAYTMFLCPAIFNGAGISAIFSGGGEGEGHIVSPLSVCRSVPYVTQMVSVRYHLKRLLYWIEILYTGI